jgi:hypothetical protein
MRPEDRTGPLDNNGSPETDERTGFTPLRGQSDGMGPNFGESILLEDRTGAQGTATNKRLR